MLYSKIKLSDDRQKLVIWTDMNTHGRSCGESRADWEKVAEIPLTRLPVILDTLVKSRDGMEIVL